jgi:membrane-associated phospholipid phosphatase
MPAPATNSVHFWHLITRLGEVQILVPAALLAALTLFRGQDSRPLAIWWIVLLGFATLVTTTTKVAFIGWGIGWAELNFTGISGHAVFAAGVYPLLLGTLCCRARPVARRFAIVAGCALALLIGASRVVVGAHSVSEVVAGLLLGGTVSAVALTLHATVRAHQISPVIPIAVALWFAIMSIHAPPSRTHSTVTLLSLYLSGHEAPYTRSGMLRDLRRRQTAPCEATACALSRTAPTEP